MSTAASINATDTLMLMMMMMMMSIDEVVFKYVVDIIMVIIRI
jgi:hypothetical protein